MRRAFERGELGEATAAKIKRKDQVAVELLVAKESRLFALCVRLPDVTWETVSRMHDTSG